MNGRDQRPELVGRDLVLPNISNDNRRREFSIDRCGWWFVGHFVSPCPDRQNITPGSIEGLIRLLHITSALAYLLWVPPSKGVTGLSPEVPRCCENEMTSADARGGRILHGAARHRSSKESNHVGSADPEVGRHL
jgi:hypothetical protein